MEVMDDSDRLAEQFRLLEAAERARVLDRLLDSLCDTKITWPPEQGENEKAEQPR